jgi:esterase/lipase superfamily enzyme
MGRRLTGAIAGGVTRVGDTADTAELSALGATVIDLTDVKASDATNHDKFVQLASVAPELRGILARGISADHRATDASERAASGVGSIVALPLTLSDRRSPPETRTLPTILRASALRRQSCRPTPGVRRASIR